MGTTSSHRYLLSSNVNTSWRSGAHVATTARCRSLHRLDSVRAHLYVGSTWIGGSLPQQTVLVPSKATIHPYVPPLSYGNAQPARLAVVPVRLIIMHGAGCNAVLEAQAWDCPWWLLARSGMTDYVWHGETGLLVDPRGRRHGGQQSGNSGTTR